MNNKISKTYIIVDSHFYHDAMQQYCNRPANFNNIIINQWKNTVQSQDIIIHLGDVIFGSKEQLTDILKDLPGTKVLIRGNHDRNHSNNWFIKAGFVVVLEKLQISGIILSHFPAIMTKEEIERNIINVHGHFHNHSSKKWEKSLKERITNNHYLLVLENVEYKPISLEAIAKRKFIIPSKTIE